MVKRFNRWWEDGCQAFHMILTDLKASSIIWEFKVSTCTISHQLCWINANTFFFYQINGLFARFIYTFTLCCSLNLFILSFRSLVRNDKYYTVSYHWFIPVVTLNLCFLLQSIRFDWTELLCLLFVDGTIEGRSLNRSGTSCESAVLNLSRSRLLSADCASEVW